jgi:hypothetical protein
MELNISCKICHLKSKMDVHDINQRPLLEVLVRDLEKLKIK